MKKIINILLVPAMALLLVACDYNERNFEGYEDKVQVKNLASYDHEISTADITTIVNALRAKKTKEDSTTATALNNAKAFSSGVSSQPLIPYVLTSAYRAADLGSSALVTFPFVNDIPEYVTKLSAAGSYVVSAADYETVWGDNTAFFTPSNAPAAKLPAILSAAFSDAADGDIKIVRYNYSENEPDAVIELLNEDFESYGTASTDTINQREWAQYTAEGTKAWQPKLFSNNKYAQMTSYMGATSAALRDVSNKNYMLSPAVNLSPVNSPKLSFDVCVGSYNGTFLKVLITETNPVTDLTAVTWDDVSASFALPTTPTSGFGTLGSAGTMDLSNYAGKTIYIAFLYEGGYPDLPETTNAKTTTYQIDNVVIKGVDKNAPPMLPANPQPNNAIYAYNGTAWAPYANTAVVLNPSDYGAMGASSLTATTAPNYLPNFLAAKFPYAQEGTAKAVVYGSQTGNPGGLAAEYQYAAGAWTPTAVTVKQTEQYVVSSQGWMFDPTIVLTVRRGAATEVQNFITYIQNSMPDKWFPYTGRTNEDHYYGFNAFYGEIMYDGTRTTYGDPAIGACATNEDKYALFDKRVEEAFPIFARINYPEMQTHVSGVEQFLKVRIEHFFSTSDRRYFEHTLKCIKSGTGESDPAEFEYIGKEQIPAL
jgi:hypothetical protein